jgi:hypothetical protein
MRFINDQCKQCPFKPKSAPGWLGSYDVGSIFRSIWKGAPFFCHSVINYSAKKWETTAMKKDKIRAPDSEVQHEPIREARLLALVIAHRVECMDARAFSDHHTSDAVKAEMAAAGRRR